MEEDRYISVEDSFSGTDEVFIFSDDTFNIVLNTFPSSFHEFGDYRVFLSLLSSTLFESFQQIGYLDRVYNLDEVEDIFLVRLADTLGLKYPLGADPKRLRLFLKYYKKIIKRRGSLNAIKRMVRLVEASERDICDMSLEDYTDIDLIKIREGSVLIRYDGITDFELTKEMMRKVAPAGYEVILANKNGPVMYSADGSFFDYDMRIKMDAELIYIDEWRAEEILPDIDSFYCDRGYEDREWLIVDKIEDGVVSRCFFVDDLVKAYDSKDEFVCE